MAYRATGEWLPRIDRGERLELKLVSAPTSRLSAWKQQGLYITREGEKYWSMQVDEGSREFIDQLNEWRDGAPAEESWDTPEQFDEILSKPISFNGQGSGGSYVVRFTELKRGLWIRTTILRNDFDPMGGAYNAFLTEVLDEAQVLAEIDREKNRGR
jgi:hypothetical protein